MKSSINILLFCLAILFIFSCERKKDFEINLPITPDLLVVNGNFVEGKPWAIQITNSRNVGDAESEINAVENATVELYEDDTFVGIMECTPSSHFYLTKEYTLDTPLPKVNTKYTLKVSAPDFSPVETSDISPSISTEILPLSYRIIGDENATEIGLNIVLKDISIQENYYHIMIRQQKVDWEVIEEDTVFTERSDLNYLSFNVPQKSTDDLLQTEYQYYSDQSPYIFDDHLFNGEEKSIEAIIDTDEYLRSPFSYEGYNGGKKIKILVEVRTISEAYYLYYKSVGLHEEAHGDPFKEPVFIYNNIEGGLGHFSGYSVQNSDTLVINVNY